MNPLWLPVVCWILLSSLVGFLLMAIDMSRAIHYGRRVRERTFYKIAAAGSAFGIVVGSRVLHHKTPKNSFTVIAAIAWLLVLFELQNLLGPLIA